ncbi:Cytochrome c551 peroxidase [Roseovarius sp. EC-HK134]|uniref:Cytochrome c551 peroxidase n=1 Tax=Roseovarius mucosus TaxID=215743 RepID=A0A1V0RN62_9RHOB|nr:MULTISPECIES: cytochrome-c peroxidase [Roseovarius]ARE83218.1 cytochrome c551 peroxidase [Roseovarius mucosus]AWZ20158.1 Cytochrome c551 peroxidase [Roseovarius sp. AK1035]VVT15454.1 Cytochrome c551 peroxidase [Roseovarius sp. EC-HK134]VVT15963.1 Cytochrome c551 peroxidase [Roseovarius sp. EC-SD190]
MTPPLKLILGTLSALALAQGAAASDLRERAQELFAPLPSTIPALNDNVITEDKIDLGKALFFDPRMSASGVFSCNSCHNLATGGDDNMETSIGHAWQKGPRNSPTVLNAVFNEAQFWDGRAADLAEQAKGPVQAGVEMANTPENVVATLMSMPQYIDWFTASFPEEENPVSFDNFAKAIEAYEATLITPSPFDAFLNGDDAALSDGQKAGLQLFIDKGCSSCHNGINLGGNGYYPFGLIEKPGADVLPPDDRGRFAVTETADDSYVFRAAPLRNIDQTAPYFHSGKVWDLKVAVQIMGTSQLGEEINDAEADQIVAFLGALTGKMPEVTYPVLPAETLLTPRPTGEVQ